MGRWEVRLSSPYYLRVLQDRKWFALLFVLCQDLVDDRNLGGRHAGLWRMVS
jgi:hypothetical protein